MKAVLDQKLSSYRPTKSPAYVGELRSKTWALPLYDKSFETSPIWSQRAEAYWLRQEQLFGLRMSNFTLLVDNFPETGPVISTFATVMDVLPGYRDPALLRSQ